MTRTSADAAIARADSAETLVAPSAELRLLLDATATSGTLSAHRVRLSNGATGASPHRHTLSSEMFYILDGVVDLLVGGDIITATTGDLVVVPAGSAHAFAASAGQDGELLVVITPGIDRFDFFRSVHSALAHAAPPSSLDGIGERFDTYPVDAPAWDALRHRPATKAR
jgi:quercetin dioxygenase-like cupin family protein